MGVTYLLDTHIVLWLLADPDRVDPAVRSTLADRHNVLLVSAVSALEIATKVRLGRLVAPGLIETFSLRITDLTATPLAVSVEHAVLAGSLAWDHRDPFDRLLVAQATHEQAVLVTVDRTINQLPLVRTLTW